MKLCISDGLDGFSVSTVCVFQRVSSYVSASRNIKKMLLQHPEVFYFSSSLLLNLPCSPCICLFNQLSYSHSVSPIFSFQLVSSVINHKYFFNFGISLFVCTTKQKQKKEQIDISFCKKKRELGRFLFGRNNSKHVGNVLICIKTK